MRTRAVVLLLALLLVPAAQPVGAANAPTVAPEPSLRAIEGQGCIETFSRVVPSGGWGVSEFGPEWLNGEIGNFDGVSVDGSVAIDASFSSSEIYVDPVLELSFPLEVLVRWRFAGSAANTSSMLIMLRHEDFPNAPEVSGVNYGRVFTSSGTFTNAEISVTHNPASQSLPWPLIQNGDWVWTRIQVQPDRTDMKLWLDGDPEPGDWTLSSTGPAFDAPPNTISLVTSPSLSQRMEVDSVEFVEGCDDGGGFEPTGPPSVLFVHGWGGAATVEQAGFLALLDPLRDAFPGRVRLFEHFQDHKFFDDDTDTCNGRPLLLPQEPNGNMPVDLEGSEPTHCDSKADMALNAVTLHNDVQDIALETGGKVIIVSNSGGAAIVRGFLSYSEARGDGVAESMVDSVVTLQGAVDGAWAATAAGASNNVIEWLFGEDTQLQGSRPAERDLAPVSDWYQWANPRPLPDVPFFNVYGDISLVTIDCPWFGGECREVDREEWGDVIMNTGTDDPFDVPPEGGARFLHGAAGAQNYQWQLKVDIERPLWGFGPSRIEVFQHPVSHFNFNENVGNVLTTDCATGEELPVANALIAVIHGRMVGIPHECQP